MAVCGKRRAPDVVVWAVNPFGGQIVRTAKSDNANGRTLIEITTGDWIRQTPTSAEWMIPPIH
jgi:hypothetical protein